MVVAAMMMVAELMFTECLPCRKHSSPLSPMQGLSYLIFRAVVWYFISSIFLARKLRHREVTQVQSDEARMLTHDLYFKSIPCMLLLVGSE